MALQIIQRKCSAKLKLKLAFNLRPLAPDLFRLPLLNMPLDPPGGTPADGWPTSFAARVRRMYQSKTPRKGRW